MLEKMTQAEMDAKLVLKPLGKPIEGEFPSWQPAPCAHVYECTKCHARLVAVKGA